MPTYIIKPLEHLLSLELPSLHMFPGAAAWPSKNLNINQKRMKKRWGYSEDRDIGDPTQLVYIYQQRNGTRNTMYLTEADLILKETADSSDTWRYRTETYTTGNVTNITGATVTGNGSTNWNTSGLARYDKFILTKDHTADQEPSGGDSNWATILSVDTATQITLDDTYAGTTGAMTETYKGRMIYTTSANKRWQVAIVDDKFCFGNSNTEVQSWAGSNYASALDSTLAKNASYLIEYGNRLCIAGPSLDISGTVSPWTLRCSAEGDPALWPGEDTTAADYDFIESTSTIAGLGKTSANIIVYKKESIIFGNRTGVSTNPFQFPLEKQGVGLWAPYGHAGLDGTEYFLGQNDFYAIEADHPQPIGERIRFQFFDIVSKTEAENTWAFASPNSDEIIWIANTSEGKWAFVLDTKDREWGAYSFRDDITGAGMGAV